MSAILPAAPERAGAAEPSAGNPIRVLVVDDHFVVRKGVCALLEEAVGITVVGEAGDGCQAVEAAARLAPAVILMDLRLPGLTGVEATRAILAAHPEVGIVVLTANAPEAEILSAFEAGALGYLAKSSEPQELLTAIRRVAGGETWLPPYLTRRLLLHLRPRPALAAEPLTERERMVLCRMAQGHGNRQIAGELGIAEITVRTHVIHILAKLEVSNRVEAVLHALRVGWACLEDV